MITLRTIFQRNENTIILTAYKKSEDNICCKTLKESIDLYPSEYLQIYRYLFKVYSKLLRNNAMINVN